MNNPRVMTFIKWIELRHRDILLLIFSEKRRSQKKGAMEWHTEERSKSLLFLLAGALLLLAARQIPGCLPSGLLAWVPGLLGICLVVFLGIVNIFRGNKMQQ